MTWYAHSLEGEPQSSWQTLADHLSGVASLASEFAAPFGAEPWGRALGLLHDVGKANEAFQRRLNGSNERAPHSAIGAFEAHERFSKDAPWLLAYAIAGHHGGVPNGLCRSTHGEAEIRYSRTPLLGQLDSVKTEQLAQADCMFEESVSDLRELGFDMPSDEELGLPPFIMEVPPNAPQRDWVTISLGMFLRMIYSSLVDADYLDTERFVAPETFEARRALTRVDVSTLEDAFFSRLAAVQAQAEDSPVNRARNKVLHDATAAAVLPPGLFTMTVPTGGGKTFSSLAFALKHAKRNGQKRIIIATPFMSITDQTARTLRDSFGEEGDSVVLEHQSSYDFDDIGDEGTVEYLKLAAQNWDVPIVVTTNVQLFESLFSNKPGKSRKVHNLANSVLILDEAQSIPDSLLKPTLAALEVLTKSYGTTAVLCSATQPALEEEWPFKSKPKEIVGDDPDFEIAFGGRTEFENDGPLELDALISRLLVHDQVLCIVGTRKEACLVYETMVDELVESGELEDIHGAQRAGFFHLSALMVPAHRMAVLDAIRERLHEGKQCVVISTQLIEAGVDVDFPTVYREMAGMDSIVQAAGRCNREGKNDKGTVHVFDLLVEGEVQKTSAWLESMKGISKKIIDNNGGAIDESLVQSFFKERYFYANKGDIDSAQGKSLYSLMTTIGYENMMPEQIACDYRFIDDETVSVFIPWGEKGQALEREISAAEYPQSYFRNVQPFSLGLRQYEFDVYKRAGLVSLVGPFNTIRVTPGAHNVYSDELGLRNPEEGEMDSLVL